MSEIMKIIDERERQKNKDRKNMGVAKVIVKVSGLNGFVARLI